MKTSIYLMLLGLISVGSAFGQERERTKSSNTLPKQEVSAQKKSVESSSATKQVSQMKKEVSNINQKTTSK